MRRLLAAIGAAAVALGSADAQAFPITFQVDAPSTAISAEITEPYPGAPQPIDVAGSASGEVFFDVDPVHGLYAPVVQAAGAALAFSDAIFDLDAPAGIVLSVAGSGVGASLTGPARFGFAVAPGTSLIDLRDSVLSLNAGSLVATGTEFGGPIDITIDLSVTPIDFVLPVNSVAQVVVQDLGASMVALTLDLPLDVAATVLASGIEMTFQLSGQLALSGNATIPEPASGLLVSFGLGLFACARRLRGGPGAEQRPGRTRQSFSRVA